MDSITVRNVVMLAKFLTQIPTFCIINLSVNMMSLLKVKSYRLPWGYMMRATWYPFCHRKIWIIIIDETVALNRQAMLMSSVVLWKLLKIPLIMTIATQRGVCVCVLFIMVYKLRYVISFDNFYFIKTTLHFTGWFYYHNSNFLQQFHSNRIEVMRHN